MSKPLSYNYSGTKGHIIETASNLPQNGFDLVYQGWEEISPPKQAEKGYYTFKEKSTGLRVRFDMAQPEKSGFAGKNHYHIMNPQAKSKKDMYLDKFGNPTKKNSKASHILPKGGK